MKTRKNLSGLKNKIKYRCAFNFQRERLLEYRYAYTERQAWLRMCKYIAKLHGISEITVMNYFNGNYDNYSIQKAVKDERGDLSHAGNERR